MSRPFLKSYKHFGSVIYIAMVSMLICTFFSTVGQIINHKEDTCIVGLSISLGFNALTMVIMSVLLG